MMNPAEFANIAQSEDSFWWYRGMRKIMFGLLDPMSKGARWSRVLEAGAGTGHFAKALTGRYGWNVFPMDLGREGLAHAAQLGCERLAQADIQWLPYAAGSFDAVVSMDVLVHLPRGEEHRPLKEFARVLKPAGLLILRVSALDILRSRHSQFAHERQRFTRERLRQAVEREGFEVIRCTYANALLLPVALLKFRVIEPFTQAALASGVTAVAGWLDRLLYAPLAAEAELIGRGVNLPLGQSLVLMARRVQTTTPANRP